MRGTYGLSISEKLDYYSMPEPMSGCFLWIGCSSKGYGRIDVGGEMEMAHRVSWEINNGAIPDGMCVLHKCDNTFCININHLFLGTQLENIKDMVKKNRQYKTLSENDVLVIRDRLLDGMLKSDVSSEFNISVSTIYNISSGKTWRSTGAWKPLNLRKKGSKHCKAKLNEDDVAKIRRDIINGTRSRSEIASMYSMSISAIKHIASGRTWRHVI